MALPDRDIRPGAAPHGVYRVIRTHMQSVYEFARQYYREGAFIPASYNAPSRLLQKFPLKLELLTIGLDIVLIPTERFLWITLHAAVALIVHVNEDESVPLLILSR